MKAFQLLALSSLIALVAGCATAKTSILPKADGSAVILASSASEAKAYEAARDDATDYCKNQKKGFVMVDQKSEYSGMDKSAKAGFKLADVLLGAASQTPTYHSTDTDSVDDYKVTMTFKCQ